MDREPHQGEQEAKGGEAEGGGGDGGAHQGAGRQLEADVGQPTGLRARQAERRCRPGLLIIILLNLYTSWSMVLLFRIRDTGLILDRPVLGRTHSTLV